MAPAAQDITDGFTLLRLNTPSTALQWAPPPNDHHVYDTMPGAAEQATAPPLPSTYQPPPRYAPRSPATGANTRPSSHPAGDTLSTCFSWGFGMPMVNALYLLNILVAIPRLYRRLPPR